VAESRLVIKPSAAKEIDAIGSRQDRQRIVARILKLSSEPHPQGCEKLVGPAGRYRIRQGDYRVVYLVDSAARIVEIIKVGHRREVYRKGT